MQVISADDRLLLAEQAITRDGAPFRTLPCLAVNPLNKYLYVFEENIGEEFAENSSPIVVYSVDFEEIARGGNDFLAEHAVVSVYFGALVTVMCGVPALMRRGILFCLHFPK